MSRFNVLVVGDDVDGQLAHFDDNRTTAPRREYVGPHVIASMARAYDLDVTDLPALAAKIPLWRACPGGVDARGLYAVTTYNRDAKWDEYEVGGSWAAFFLLKPVALASEASPSEIRAPLRAAIARKGDIDFDGMRSEAEARGREVWRAYAAAVTGTPETIPAVVFDAKVRNGDMSRAAARRAYRSQPRVQAFHKVMEPLLGPFVSLEEFPSTEEDFVSAQRRAAGVPFAYLRNGVWRERAGTGWFGSIATERDDDWYAEVDAMLAELPDDALLTIVDCHI